MLSFVPVSPNKNDRSDITEKLLKLTLNIHVPQTMIPLPVALVKDRFHYTI